MLKEERFTHILTALKRKGKVNLESLSSALNVSEDTVRRDLDSLHNNGLLVKVRGGAISLSRNPLSFEDRTNILSEEKNIVALKAQQLIKECQEIFLDGGPALCALASHIPANIRLRVVTNNMALVPIIAKYKHI